MPATLAIHDEITSGQKTNTFTLACLTEQLSVRESIRARIYQGVQDYNQKEPDYFRGLVEPANALSGILGKAFLLAEDTHIQDPTSTRQIQTR